MTTPEQPLIDRVVSFVRKEVPPPLTADLGPSTDLRKDLRMAEEDAEELLAQLFQEFSIAPGDFNFARYFPAEGLWPLPRLRKAPSPVPLTIGMLALAARDHVWNTESLESGR